MTPGFSWADLANLGGNVAIVLLFLRYLSSRDALFAAALRELTQDATRERERRDTHDT